MSGIRNAAGAIGAGIVADLAAVLIFAVAGRGTHGEAITVWALLSTAGPFLLGLVVAWLLARGWRAPLAVRTGLVIWPVTAAVGLAVRAAFTGRLPGSFALVVVLVLGLLLLGWRAVVAVAQARYDHRGDAAA